MGELSLKTDKPKQVIDLTDRLDELTKDSGVLVLNLLHTTAAISTADLDPGTDLDMLDAFEELIPNLNYRHPHNPAHVPDHILSTLIGTSLSLPVDKGELVLGRWQRVVMFEFDGPRERTIDWRLVQAKAEN